MKQKMTRWQKVGFCAAALLPALWLLCGLFIWIMGGSVPTMSFILTYLLLPAAALLLLRRTIRSNKHAAWKWVLSIVILCLSILLDIMLMGAGHFSIYDHADGDKALEMYESDIGHYELMPEATDLGNPEQIEYHYFYNQIATFFDSDCYTLICTYSPEDYATMTAELEDRYTFHTEPLDAGETDLPPLYTLDGYEFRFLDMASDTYHLMYPKTMILIGTNEETHEIVWSCYDDDDLDYIPDPEEFLLEDCGWKFIR